MQRDDLHEPARVQLPDGAELHFIERGSGPPVLLLHGGMGDCQSWPAQMHALAPSYRVIAFSRRHSSPNENRAHAAAHSIEIDIQDLEAFLLVLNIGPAHFVGTSYGALVALAFALRRPDKVLSLVLAEPPLHRWACRTPDGTALHDAFMAEVWCPASQAFARGCDRLALQLLTDGIWGRPVFDTLSPQRLAAALRNAGSMKAQMRSPTPFHDLPRSQVAQLDNPTLLVNGSQASALHRRVVEELDGVMQRSRRAVIEGAGHGSPFEKPHAFNAALLGFLAEQAR